MEFHSTYKGVNIYRNTPGGYRLPWITVSPRLAADTLAGIRRAITEYLTEFDANAYVSDLASKFTQDN